MAKVWTKATEYIGFERGRVKLWRHMRKRAREYGLPRMMAIEALRNATKVSVKDQTGQVRDDTKTLIEYLEWWLKLGTNFPPSRGYIRRSKQRAEEASKRIVDKFIKKSGSITTDNLPKAFQALAAAVTGLEPENAPTIDDVKKCIHMPEDMPEDKAEDKPKEEKKKKRKRDLINIGHLVVNASGSQDLIEAATKPLALMAATIANGDKVKIVESTLEGIESTIAVLTTYDNDNQALHPVAILITPNLFGKLRPHERSGLRGISSEDFPTSETDIN